MQATTGYGAPVFRGSISRRFIVLSAHILAVVAIIGSLSVYRARRIVRLHTEIGGLGAHIEALDRLETALSHLRAETQDALFLGKAFDDRSLNELRRRVRDQWMRFEQMHSRDGRPWVSGTALEREMSRELEESLERFIQSARLVVTEKRLEAARLRDATFMLHTEARRLQEGLGRLTDLHRDLMADRSRLLWADLELILWTNVGLVALLGLTVALGSFLFVCRVALPLRRLNTAALDVADGNFTRTLPISSRDEIGRLAHSFNRMGEALSERDARLRRRAQEMEILYRIGTDLSSVPKIDQAITSVVASTRTLFGADAVGLSLADGTGEEIRWTVFPGGDEVAHKEIRLISGHGLACRVLATGEVQTVEDASRDLAEDPEAHPILAAEGLPAALAVPLRRPDRTLGALMVAYRLPRRFADGVGFDPAMPPGDGRRHHGLTGMRARAESVGGELTVHSTAGGGTRVVFRVRPAGRPRGGTG